MGTYSALFSIEVGHRYFADELCPALYFVPTPKTGMVINNAGLLTRSTVNGVRVFYDTESPDSLRLHASDADVPLRFEYKVFSRDPNFLNYTELPATEHPGNEEDAILYFDNLDSQTDETGRTKLQDQEYAGASDLEKLDSALLEHILSARDRLAKPVCVVSIRLPESAGAPLDLGATAGSRRYVISFDAKRTIWKYYLLGDLAIEDLYIAGLDNGIEFESGGLERLVDNRPALTFRSKTTIQMRHRQDIRFQLREQNSGGGKVLIRRLPVASANQIGRAIIDGEAAPVSEMFINC